MATINGTIFNNILTGTSDDDTINGGLGADTMSGGLGNDTYIVENLLDRVTELFNEGIDTVNTSVNFSLSANVENLNVSGSIAGVGSFGIGNNLNNTIIAVDGFNYLTGGDGNDTLRGGDGNDRLFGDSGDNVYGVGSFTGDDALYGDAGDDYLNGGSGTDALEGGTGNDTLEGGAGADTLTGGAGDDELNGGTDTNILAGGAGNDTYVVDGIYDYSTDNFTDIVIEAVNEGTDAIITIGDYILPDNVENLTQIGTAAITGWGNALNNVLTGSTANNELFGEAGDDVLNGGVGNDTLVGGDGSDTYMFNQGSGRDSIFNDSSDSATATDTLIFGAGITPDAITLYGNSSNRDKLLILAINGTTDRVSLYNSSKLDTIQFANGTVWNQSTIASLPLSTYTILGDGADNELSGHESVDTLINGLAGNDTLSAYGAGNNTLIGGEGDDYLVANNSYSNNSLIGGTGNDYLTSFYVNTTYIYNLGDGQDIIDGFGTLVFGSSISPADIVFERHVDTSLTLKISGSTDSVTLGGYFGDNLIEIAIQFANGTVWDQSTIASLSLPITVVGTEEGEHLFADQYMDSVVLGLAGNDELNGFEGRDTLIGGDGSDAIYDNSFNSNDDTLIGGRGDDYLTSSDGNDTYVFNLGDGKDYILETGDENSIDTLVFGAGINPNAVTLHYSYYNGFENWVLSIAGTTDSVMFDLPYHENGSNSIDRVEFADGTVWNLNDINLPISPYVNTVTGDNTDNYLYGGYGLLGFATDSVIYGLGGNDYLSGSVDDTLDGGDGNDTLNGGGGTDIMIGGAGNDTYIVSSTTDSITDSAGTDTVQSTVTYDLSSHTDLENLTLIESANINGTGNAFDNVMTGNSGDNLLDGGAGADTATGGVGNDLLIGGLGNDVLIFNLGDGQDTIDNYAADNASTVDVLQFGAGIRPEDIEFHRYVNNVDSELVIKGTSDTLTMKDYFANNGSYYNAYVHFADGTVWTPLQMFNMGGVYEGDSADNAMTGWVGNDTLISGAGNDTLDGGSGNDTSVYSGSWVNYTVTGNATSATVSGVEGTDTLSNIETLSFNGITVNTGDAVNDNPIGVNDTNSSDAVIEASPFVTGDASAVGNVLSNDTDADLGLGLGESLVVSAIAGGVVGSAVTGTYGSIVLNADGSYVYTLDNNDADTEALTTGQTVNDVFSYTVIDVHGATGTATLTLAISGNNDVSIITGTSTNDNLIGTSGADTLNGLAGNDTLDGGLGADVLDGGAGDDSYYVDNVGDNVIDQLSTGGVDHIFSSVDYSLSGRFVEDLTLIGSDNVSATGNTLSNNLTGNSGNNTLIGGSGDDFLDGGLGVDVLDGGDGSDLYYVDNVGDNVIEQQLTGGDHDTIISSVSYSLIGRYVESLQLLDYSGTDDLILTGNSLNNNLSGNYGNNTLIGGGGDDFLYGDAGADVMDGGAGNDEYNVDNIGDNVINERIDGGLDTIYSSVSYSLIGRYVENLTIFNINLDYVNYTGTGNSLNNVLIVWALGNDTLIGAGGNDTLDGGLGADVLDGGVGDDVYYVDDIGDNVINESLTGGIDTILSSVNYSLSGRYVERLTLTGTSDLIATGNSVDNMLTGNSGNNTLIGGAGNDTYMFGLGGGQDVVTDTFGATDVLSVLSGVAREQLWFTHSGNNLEVSIIGTTDKVTISNWYVGGASNYNQVEEVHTASGNVLLSSQVESLVSAMAGFSPPSVGTTTLDSGTYASVLSMIAANWS